MTIRAPFPFVEKRRNDCWRNSGVIDEGDQGCLSIFRKFTHSGAIEAPISLSGSGLTAKLDATQSFAQLVSTMAQDDDDCFHTTFAQVVDAAFDDGLFPKGSSGLNAPMRLERPAARRIAAT
jgi:hypothetical protein